MSNFIKTSIKPLKKKALTGLTWGVVVSTIVWSLGVASVMQPQSARAAQDGDLIKAKEHEAVYWLLGGKRYVFPHAKHYFTWFPDFSTVITVSLSELQSYPIGGNVCQRPGTRMVKIQTDPKTYAVEPGCKLRWVTSEAVANEIYGPNWNKRIDDVSDAFFVNYTMGADLMSGEFPVGSLVQEEGSATVYYIDENKTKRPVASEAAMSANRFKMGDVLKVAAGKLSAYTAGTSVTGKEDALANYGGFAGGTPAAAGGTLSLKLSANTPAAGTAVKGAARLPFTYIDMTATGGDVVIDSFTVRRGGIAQDSVFADLTFLVDGVQIGLNKTLNAQHETTVYDDITVKNGTTAQLQLTGNTASSLASNVGEQPTLGLVGMTLKQGTLAGGQPNIFGNPMTANNSVAIGTVTVARGPLDPNAATNQKIGTKDYTFTSVKLTVGSAEDVQVEEIVWDQAGSADDMDISNVKLKADGTVVATMEHPVSKKVHFKLSPAIKVEKGKNVELSISADIDSGSNRTIDFDIEKNTDLVVKGLTYGYYILATGWPSGTDPRLSGFAVTIDTGTLKITPLATSSNKIADGGKGQVLGMFEFEAKGEDVQITTLGIQVQTVGSGSSPATTSDVTNITLVDPSGKAVAGPKDPTYDYGTGLTSFGSATTTDTIVVPVGVHKYTIKGDLSTDFAANNTVAIQITPGANVTAKGVSTGKTITATPSTVQTSTTQTVQAGSLAVSVSNTPVAQTVVAGTNGFTFANIVLDAQASGEDIRVTQLKLTEHTTGSAYPAVLSGLKLYDGATELTTSNDPDPTSTTAAANATSTFTFVNALVVPKGTTKTITAKANISKSVTSGTVAIGLQNDGSTNGVVSATGKDTGSTITPTYTYSDGQSMTLASAGTLNIAADASTPVAGLLPKMTSGVTVGVFTAQALNEDVNLEKVYVAVTDVNSGGPDQFDKVYLTDGTKTVGVTATTTDSTASPTSVLFDVSADPFVISANTTKQFTLKVDTSDVDGSLNKKGASGEGFQLSIAATGDVTAKGASSGNNATVNGTATFNAFTLYASVPTVDVTSSPVTNKLTANGNYELFKFKVTADPKGPVGLYKFTFGITTTTVSVSSLELYDSTYTAGSVGTLANATEIGEGNNVGLAEFLFDTDSSGTGNGGEFRQVAAGSTSTFTLKGTVTGYTSNVSNGVNVVLAGDAAFPSTVMNCAGTTTGNNACTGVDSDDQDDFIWSDLNYSSQYNTTTATNTREWTNGFRVKGLQSTTSTAQAI